MTTRKSTRSRSTRTSSGKRQPARTRPTGRQLPQRRRREPARKVILAEPGLSPGAIATAQILGSADAELPAAPELRPILPLPLRDIDPANPFQTRRFPLPDDQNPYLLELAANIREKGVVIPILVRVLDDGSYKLLAGECRYRASSLQLPHLDEIGPAPLYIPAVLLHNLTDAEAGAITAIENLKRCNLLPFEEVETVAMLLRLHGGDPAAVARDLGQSPAWIVRRARVHTSLIAEWKEAITGAGSTFWSWTIQHLEEVAKLGAAEQADLLNRLQSRYSDPHLTVQDLRRQVADMTLRLDRAPFDLVDDTLHPQAGACATCPLNTFANPLLFDDQDEQPSNRDLRNARCLSRTCFLSKCHASIERQAAAAREKHPDLVLVRTAYQDLQLIPPAWRSEALTPGSFEQVKKGTSGARPAFVVQGPEAGKRIWIKDPSDESPSPASEAGRSPAVPTTSEGAEPQVGVFDLGSRRQKHLNRRIALLTNRTQELVQAFDGATLPTETLLTLTVAIGTSRNAKTLWPGALSFTPWPTYHQLASSGPEPTTRVLWRDQLLPVLVARLQYNGPDDFNRLLVEIRETLILIGQDPDALYRDVAKDLPEPKAWFKVHGHVPEVVEDLVLPSASEGFLANDREHATAHTFTTAEDDPQDEDPDSDPPFHWEPTPDLLDPEAPMPAVTDLPSVASMETTAATA